MRCQAWIAVCCWVSAAAACRTGEAIEPYNELPVADSKVLKNGVPVEAARDGSIADLIFPYPGAPVAITLDGTASYDPDGKITGYHWLSGSRVPDAGLPPPWTPDAGTPVPFLRRPPPAGALTEASPTLMLDAGVWAFSLWVLDDHGAWSAPDTIRLIVGDPPPPARDGGMPPGDAGVPPDGATGADATIPDAGDAGDAAPGEDAAEARPAPADGGGDAASSSDASAEAGPSAARLTRGRHRAACSVRKKGLR